MFSQFSDNQTIDEISLEVLKLQMIPNVAWVLLGLFGTVGNLILSWILLRNAKLRSNFYLCLLHLSVADMLLCANSVVTAFKRLSYLSLGMPETNSPLMCFFQTLPWLTFKNVSLGQAVTIALDRVMCAAVPLRYRTFRTRRLQLINLAMWIIILIIVIYAASNINSTALIPCCTIAMVWTPAVMDLSSYLGITLDLINVFFYALLSLILIFRLKDAKRKGLNVHEVKKSIQLKAAITSFMLLGVYVCVSLTGELFLRGTNDFDTVTKSTIQPYGNVILMVGCDLTLIVCIVRNEDIRKLIVTLLSSPWVRFRNRHNQVYPTVN